MALALCPGSQLTNTFYKQFSDVILATTGGVQSCAPVEDVHLFAQNSAAFGRFGCDVDNQVFVNTAGTMFTVQDYAIYSTFAAFRQVPVAVPATDTTDAGFNLCLTFDEHSTGFLLLLAELISASAFVETEVGRLPQACRKMIDYAVGDGVVFDGSGVCNPTFTTAPTTAPSGFTGDCDPPCAEIAHISLQSPYGKPAICPAWAAGFGDRVSINVFFEKFVGPNFCFSAVDLLSSCGSFIEPCEPCTSVPCPPQFATLPTSGPFVLMTLAVGGQVCEVTCPPAIQNVAPYLTAPGGQVAVGPMGR